MIDCETLHAAVHCCNSAPSAPLPVTVLCKPQISGLKMSKLICEPPQGTQHGSGGGSSSTGVVMTGNNGTAGHNEHETPLRMSTCGTDIPYYRRCIGRRSLVRFRCRSIIAGGRCIMCIACASDTPSLRRPNDALSANDCSDQFQHLWSIVAQLYFTIWLPLLQSKKEPKID